MRLGAERVFRVDEQVWPVEPALVLGEPHVDRELVRASCVFQSRSPNASVMAAVSNPPPTVVKGLRPRQDALEALAPFEEHVAGFKPRRPRLFGPPR